MKKIFLVFPLLYFLVSPLNSTHGNERNNAEELLFFVDPIATSEKISFELVLKNESDSPKELEFPSSQLYELTVRDPDGKIVYTFSEDKMFAQVITTVQLAPKEKKVWVEEWIHSLQPGAYEVTAQLLSSKAPLSDTKNMNVPAENPVFKEVETSGKGGNYVVKGLANPTNGQFFYTVEDGHNELVLETAVSTKTTNGKWYPFSIKLSIPKEKLPRNGTLVLHLYERSEQNEIIHSYPALLETFY
ncbi:BsuPI-related putative proteinase inhibitor [Bacillus sp. B15-48]|uniref:BsuPI-related putative proteinase inhibitor n=1 Tax=Bacillus sp. B15-48 TaxID=1548601 RepID=UPI00193F0801|nr:BsuPI-related putative proteinase inhibitor [Bacillus sp. B15-48]